MKIISLQAENFKRLRAIEIKPTGPLVEITGRNRQGKSSVLDAIYAALGGKDAHPSQPVRTGEDKAMLRLDLGELVVTRRFTAAGGTSLIVEAQDGARYQSPQAVIDKLMGHIAFDPMEFSRAKPAVQMDMLRSLVKLDVDIDALDQANATDFDARTTINRDAKTARTQAEAITVPEGLPAQPVDVSALMDEMARAAERNTDIETRKGRRATVARDIADNRQKVINLEASLPLAMATIETARDHTVTDIDDQIRRLQERRDQVIATADADIAAARLECKEKVAAATAAADADQKRLDDAGPLPDPIDVAALRLQIDTATTTNAGIAKRTERATLEKKAADEEARSEALTKAMAERTEKKRAAIAAAKMPVDGLSFGEGEIMFDGVPFSQAAGSEQLRVSVAIAMAANPKLRVLRVKDGGLLDEDAMRLLSEMADAADYQVWIELVDSSGKIGIVMEDGAVAAAAQPADPGTETPPPAARRSRKPQGDKAAVAAAGAGSNLL